MRRVALALVLCVAGCARPAKQARLCWSPDVEINGACVAPWAPQAKEPSK